MTSTPMDARKFRDALGCYASGLVIVGAVVDGAPVGFTCQSFYSVSLAPPLVSFCVMNSSKSWPRIRTARHFGIHVLAESQRGISNAFASPTADRWAGVDWRPSPRGVPLIGGAMLGMECSLHDEHEAGDHRIVVCHVHDIHVAESTEARPLLYFGGAYRSLEIAETR